VSNPTTLDINSRLDQILNTDQLAIPEIIRELHERMIVEYGAIPVQSLVIRVRATDLFLALAFNKPVTQEQFNSVFLSSPSNLTETIQHSLLTYLILAQEHIPPRLRPLLPSPSEHEALDLLHSRALEHFSHPSIINITPLAKELTHLVDTLIPSHSDPAHLTHVYNHLSHPTNSPLAFLISGGLIGSQVIMSTITHNLLNHLSNYFHRLDASLPVPTEHDTHLIDCLMLAQEKTECLIIAGATSSPPMTFASQHPPLPQEFMSRYPTKEFSTLFKMPLPFVGELSPPSPTTSTTPDPDTSDNSTSTSPTPPSAPPTSP
jgi:hypothetical protein